MRREISKQPVKQRIKNFSEVASGYTHEEAKIEAMRCLGCPNPLCVNGCPVGIAIPSFIKFIQQGQPNEALKKIKEKNNLPAVCGRVCPQENQCEAACILNKKGHPINIGALERYAADYVLAGEPVSQLASSIRKPANPQTRKPSKVAVVGSGPAGLTCAADLAKMGYQISLFESLHLAGGVLVYGIPEFRLPKQIVHAEVEYIKNLGVTVVTDTLIGTTYTIQDLFKDGFIAVFIASGAGLGQLLGIQGENLNRVYSANEFLTRINLMKAYKFPEYATPVGIGKSAAVIGGGNVAVDCARAALRLNCRDGVSPPRVILVYRRGEKEMPARLEEIENAKEEGVIFEFLTQPVGIIGDEKGFVKTLECVKMKLGEPDATGRKRPIPVENSRFSMNIDTVIVAIGQNPNPLLPKLTPGLKTNNDGTICVDKNLMTSIEGVFGGGDIITGADTVISAMAAGKKGAVEIDKYVRNVKRKVKT
ncbi:MAG: NADPH-dependent glutamate synthase [Candidatus Omnitrophota bacterium]